MTFSNAIATASRLAMTITLVIVDTMFLLYDARLIGV